MTNFELVTVNYAWHDDLENVSTGTIYVGNYDYALEHPEIDDQIFFYVNNKTELKKLYEPNNGLDFYLVKGN